MLAPRHALASQAPHESLALRRRRARRRLLVMLALLAGGAIYSGVLARDVWHEAMAGRAELMQGLAILTGGPLSSLRSQRLAAATADFRAAEKSFAAARARLGPWGELATTWGGVLPGRAREVQAVAPLLDFAQQTAGAAASLGDGLRPVVSLVDVYKPFLEPPGAAGRSTEPGVGDSQLVRLTAALEQAQPATRHAQQHLAAARVARGRLVGMLLPAGIAPLLSRFDQHEATLALALTYARGLPALLGAQGPRTYLLVYQDPADLRATGGYIGSASAITLDHGRLSQVDYEDSKQLQVPRSRSIPAPEPLFYYEGYGSLELRDANYWPDFPTSARQIAHIYQVITGRHLDGVVAVQPSLVAYLLRGLGPLAVPEFHETVTAANVVRRVEYYTHNGPAASSDPHRKRFIIAVNHALLGALLHGGLRRLAAVLPEVERAFADRLILASVDDPLVAQALDRLHWDGALRTDPGDYLAVFDQSLTDSKLNPFVAQSISYEAQRRPDGGLDSSVTITYVNRAPHTLTWQLPRADYQNYLRVAVPGQSDLHAQAGYDDAFWPDEVERGRKLVAGYVEVPDDATRSMTLRYSVPPSALAAVPGYRLVVQKQPGSGSALVAVRVSAGGRTWTAHTVLRQDTVFSTPWDAPSGALRVSVDATTPAVSH